MYKQYKKIKKGKSNLIKTSYIIIILIIILMCVSIGYSYWSTQLYITGTAELNYIELKLDKVTVNASSGQYVTVVEDYGIDALEYDSSEVQDGEIIEVIGSYSSDRWIVISRDVVLQMNITNNYDTTITAGEAEILENTTGYSVSFNLDNIEPGNSGYIGMQITIKGSSYVKTGTIRSRVYYNVNGDKRFIYFTINLSK